MATKLKQKYYAHNEYDDGTEIFTVDTISFDDSKIDVTVNEENKTVYIYTPGGRKDLQVNLPDSFNPEDYSQTFKNGVLSIEWSSVEDSE